MKRIDRIRNMSIGELAEKLMQMPAGTYNYCAADCKDFECTQEKQCCINWLNEEVGGRDSNI